MINHLRPRLRGRQTSYGLWVTVESPAITEIAVALGMDWVSIDMEHGHLGLHHVMEHLRAANGSETTVLVRVPGIEMSSIKRALDMGAGGVIVPYVQSRDDVEMAFRFGRYPPRGLRGVGGDRSVKWGLEFQEYLLSADEETLIIPIIETRGAIEEIDAILDVQGLEAIFFGPADLSSSYGALGEWEGPGIAERILEVRAKAATKGISTAIMARSVEDACKRRDQGFQMVGVGADMPLLIRALREALTALRRNEG